MRLIDVLNNDIVKNENDFSNTRDLIILKNNEEWKTVKEKIKAMNVTRVLYEFFEKIDDIYGGHYTLWNTQQSVDDLLDKITKDCNNIPEFIRKTWSKKMLEYMLETNTFAVDEEYLNNPIKNEHDVKFRIMLVEYIRKTYSDVDDFVTIALENDTIMTNSSMKILSTNAIKKLQYHIKKYLSSTPPS